MFGGFGVGKLQELLNQPHAYKHKQLLQQYLNKFHGYMISTARIIRRIGRNRQNTVSYLTEKGEA